MPIIEKVKPNDTLPASCDVVVIGAGIVGISTALELAERGLSVVVLEKGEVAAEQSSRNWGWCRQMGRDPREIPLILESLKIWRGMNERVGAETGFRQCGIAYVASSESELNKYDQWQKNNAALHGIDSRLLDSKQVAELLPGCTQSWTGALYTPSDCRAEPFIAVPAMARALQKLGGKVFTQCAVRGLETAAGSVSSVVTERGVIACKRVVLAGGFWSRRFLHNLGIAFPQLGVLGSVMRTSALDSGFTTSFSAGKFTARKRLDGGFTVTHNHVSVADIVPDSFRLFFDFLPVYKLDWRGLRLRIGKRFIDEAQLARRWSFDQISPFERVRILDPDPAQWILDEATAEIKKTFPVFAQVKIEEQWGGIIDATPDAVPVIGPLARIPGLFLASGFSGHGFGLGPGAGKLMAQLVVGEPTCVDPKPFRFERFADGSWSPPTTGV
jgi:glycine/D-amino acid oxidase-like deaminating enzyme